MSEIAQKLDFAEESQDVGLGDAENLMWKPQNVQVCQFNSMIIFLGLEIIEHLNNRLFLGS